MTRSHKFNNKDHAAIAEGAAMPHNNMPHFFAKNGYAGVDPKKIKKNGGGKGNWGHSGAEALDGDFNFSKIRRRSNSNGALIEFKTKFDINEHDPVFEEEVPKDELCKTETSSSTSSIPDKA